MKTEAAILAFGILSSSFFGSWHCGAMCGPVVSLVKARGSLLAYHIGRGTAYVLLGVLAGTLGAFFLGSSFSVLRYASILFLAAGLLFMGLRLIAPRGFALYFAGIEGKLRIHSFVVNSLPVKSAWRTGSGLALGLLSGLLPCGWLYTYVLAAAATKSPSAGAITMALFWLGGLPVLTALPSLLKAGIASAGLKQQRIAGAILIASSLYSLVVFSFAV